jgi:pimeloyl-ACP methyl ester carboxylesterase
MPFSYRGEIRELDELTRKEASGSFVQLPIGITHYELSNPEVENTVVLVHGFSTPYFIFDPTFDFLSQAGLRVLRYDLFGRGFSDRPETRYHITLFVRQLHDLLDALALTGPVSLVGLSMGGPITAAFAARFPERVKKLVLIDPTGVKRVFPLLALKAATIPGLGETILNVIGNGGMVKNITSDFFDRTYTEHFQSRYLVQMQYKGFKQAILSTIRNGMLDPFMDDYQRIGKMGEPVLLFWGRQDQTVPFHHSIDLREAIPQAKLHVIEDCGHIPHYEKPGEVNPILLQFLQSETLTARPRSNDKE